MENHILLEVKVLIFSHLQMKMSIRKYQEVILVHVVELQDEIKVNKEKKVALDDCRFFLINLMMYSLME